MKLLQGLETLLRTAVAVLLVPLFILFYSLAALALAGLPAHRVHRVYVSFAGACLLVAGTRLVVHGTEHLEPERAYVVVPNHDSGVDPLCILAALPQLVIRFVTKQEFMRIPVLGQAMRRTGNIRVVRRQTEDDVERIHAVMDRRDPAVSILFFAEGTRSRDGALHAFKGGAFATALGYGLPILPVGLAGTRHVWQRGILRVRRATVAIEVGVPIESAGLGMQDRHLLRDRSFAAVQELRAAARERLRGRGIEPGGID